jgi:uncharacterized damage-inducible protein DinB
LLSWRQKPVKKRVSIEPEDWIEKRFEFNHPVGAFPAILERVRGTPARLDEMVRSFPKRILTARIGDAWSIQEHVGHLYDLDELHEGRLDDYAAKKDTLRAADMTNKKTYEAEHNKASIEKLLSQFREARMRFVAGLEEMSEEEVATSAIHPRLHKPMRVLDLAQFVAEHDDHHLASMRRVAEILQSR